VINLRLLRLTAMVALLPTSAALAQSPAILAGCGSTMTATALPSLTTGFVGVPGAAKVRPRAGIMAANASPQDTEETCSSSGVNNTVEGTGAGNSLPPAGSGGSYNSLFGVDAGYSVTTGSYNDFHGANAGYSTATDADGNCGGYNVFFGYYAGQLNTSGSSNIYIGPLAGATGLGYNVAQNVAVGTAAGYTLTGTVGSTTYYGKNNIYIGFNTGEQSYGIDNTFVGFESGFVNTSGSFDVFVGGHCTGYSNISGEYDNFFGLQAGYSNTSGNYNDFFGSSAGLLNSTATDNDFYGYQAGSTDSTGAANALYGYRAGYQSTGSDNAVFGARAGYGMSTSYDTILGAYAGINDTGSGNNSFLGYEAGYGNTSGVEQVFVGYYAGYGNTTGNDNVAVGMEAGYNSVLPLETGSQLTFLGATATANADALTNSTAIGYGAEITASNQIAIGDGVSSVTTTGVLNSGNSTTMYPGGALLNGKYVYSGVKPTMTSTDGLGTMPNIVANGTTSFEIIADSSGMMLAQVTLNLPPAQNGWACPVLRDISKTPVLTGGESATGPTTVTYTFTLTPSYSDKFIGGCTGSF